jgi:hypothetical protein
VQEVDVPDDRSQNRGFFSIVQAKYFERLRKVVAAKFDPIKDENSRVVKVMKNTFRQCLKSPHVLRHVQAHEDIVAHLQVLGGSPFVSKHVHFNPDKFNDKNDFGIQAIQRNLVPNDFTNEDELWSGDSFNVTQYFEHQPWHAMVLFFDLVVGRCGDAVCLEKPAESWGYSADDTFEFESYRELLRTLDDAFIMRPQLRQILVDQVYRPSIKRQREFINERVGLQKSHGKSDPTKIRIENLQKMIPEINWLRVINSDLLNYSKLTESDEILINGGIELLQKLVKNLMEGDKK